MLNKDDRRVGKNPTLQLLYKEDIVLANIEEKIENRVSPIIEDLGYKLYDVQYAKEGKDYFLRIFIEKENGEIDLNDCETVNNAITDILDEDDYIKEQYFLEVSSTGVEKLIRKEKHMQENLNEIVTINLFKPIDGSKEYIGKLTEFNDQILKIELEDETILELERKNISLIKKYYDWNK